MSRRRQEARKRENEKKIAGKMIVFSHKHPNFSWIFCYSLLFLLVACCVFSVNINEGYGLIWRVDGKAQYFPYMSYLSSYVKEFFANITDGTFVLRMYDFTIGMGEDIRSVVRIHPTEYLSVLFETDQLEHLYNFLMVFRYYLAGLSFYAFCRHKNVPRSGTMVGVFAYIFSGYGLTLAANHPIFNAPVILLPLLLIGLDWVIDRRGFAFFSFVVAISMSINYYFLYITTIAMAVYGLLQFFDRYRENRLREFFSMLGRIVVSYLIGIGMSAVFFIPTVFRALTSNRVGKTRTLLNLFSYGKDHYIKVFTATITGMYYPEDISLGFVVLFLPALAVLFLGPIKKNLKLKIILIIECVCVMLPAAGLVLSAFSTITNRWVYIFALTAAYMIAVLMEDFKKMSILQCLGIVAITILYYFAYRYQANVGETYLFEIRVTLILLIITTVILLCIRLISRVGTVQLTAIMLILTIVSLTAHGVYMFGNSTDPLYQDYVKNDTEMDAYINNEEYSHLAEISDSSFYRVDVSTTQETEENNPLFFGYNGTSIYNSVINRNVINYHTELESAGLSAVHRIYNFDGRTALEELAAVKYYQTTADDTADVPYGFEKSEMLSDDQTFIYENKYPLSIGYTYTKTLSKEAYEQLSALEKQQAMLSYAVIDEEDADVTDESVENAGITYEDLTGEQENDFSITVERKQGYEVYLELVDCSTTDSLAKLLFLGTNLSKTVTIRNPNDTYAVDRNDYLVNLGYCKEDSNEKIEVSAVYPEEPNFHISKIRVCYVPMEKYVSSVIALQQDSLSNVDIGVNTVSGKVTTSQDETMVFTIPYSSGWSATVDGNKVELLRANTAYMAVALTEGNHEIVLTYETPGLRAGAIISAVSLIVLGVLLIAVKRRKTVNALSTNEE